MSTIERDDGDHNDRDQTILEGIWLVKAAVKRYARRRGLLTLDDLHSWGIIGLIKAVDTFNPSHARGASMVTWATTCIRRTVEEAVRESMPLNRYQQWLLQKGVGTRVYERTFTESAPKFDPKSMEARPALLTDEESPEIAAVHADVSSRLLAEVMKLPPRESAIIIESFWLRRTFREIGAELGINGSRVCQIRTQSLATLRLNPAVIALQ